MRQHLAFVITSLTCAGCSLIYNPNNLPAASDAQIDAEIIDPAMLEIDDVVPGEIFEGQGEHGSRPALVVIHGRNIIDRNTVVEITPVSGTARLSFGTPVIAADGHWIAVAITAHVDRMLTQGEQVALDVKVTQELPPELGGGTPVAMLQGKLELNGLKELTHETRPEVAGSNIDTSQLEAQYSRVDLSQIDSATFVGEPRAIIRSVSSITAQALAVNAPRGASGGAGGGGAEARVGGCDGGNAGSRGGCGGLVSGEGGAANGALSTAGGGGGGGFSEAGMPGAGSIAGGGGSGTGDALIVTYGGVEASSPNLAGGGGGGGATTLGKGGGGGAGGGSIELTAGGDLSVASIAVDGGAGGDGQAGGGGGGGAGGLVLLRAGASFTATGMISVNGGAGGSGTGGSGNGGRGAPGRVRWDALADMPPNVSAGTLRRGPSFQLDTQVFRTARPSITVIGTTSDRFDTYWDQKGMRTTGASYSIGAAGATITPVLREGFNRLCLTLAGGQQGTGEADKCVDVAFLP